jgi:3-methyladenine DNA glycosylase/8-oxoguanine DNA glycosylase
LKKEVERIKKTVVLSQKWRVILFPKPPFNFQATVYNPSHFPIPTEVYQPGFWWQATRLEGLPLGFEFENLGTVEKPKVGLTLSSQKKLSSPQKERIVNELKYRFELDLDLSEFYRSFKKDKYLGPVLKKWRGVRSKCGYSFYESLMIYLVLQNATVGRTIQMMRNLLEKYGDKIRLDHQELFCFWEPKEMAKISEKELKDLKVGYRAKYFLKTSQAFLNGKYDEHQLRLLKPKEILERVDEIYGIGPASASYLLFEVFHNHETFEVLPPWEQKIYSRLLYGKELVPAKKILAEFKKRYLSQARFAAHLLFTDLFWRHKKEPIDWLEKLVRR